MLSVVFILIPIFCISLPEKYVHLNENEPLYLYFMRSQDQTIFSQSFKYMLILSFIRYVYNINCT